MTAKGDIIKVAVLCIIEKEGMKRLLMCKKSSLKGILQNLGGTFDEELDKGSTDDEKYQACARREVLEETGKNVSKLKYYKSFEGQRIDEPESKITLVCYFGKLEGNPEVQPGDSIIGFEWVSKDDYKNSNYSYKFPETSSKAFDKLISDGYL